MVNALAHSNKTIVISKKEIRRKIRNACPTIQYQKTMEVSAHRSEILYFDQQIICTHIGNLDRKQPRFLYRKLWNNRELYNVWV